MSDALSWAKCVRPGTPDFLGGSPPCITFVDQLLRMMSAPQRRLYRARDSIQGRVFKMADKLPAANSVLILCYHAIADLSDDAILADYSIPEPEFVKQLESLVRRGFHFISGEQFYLFLVGKAEVPSQSVLLTFDDCYVSLIEVVAPLLNSYGASAVAFAVTGLASNSNEWDQRIGSCTLPILNQGGLRKLAERGFEIGSHTRTHPSLPRLGPERLREEVEGSAIDIAALGLPTPRFFAYPYGNESPPVRQAVAAAGYSVGFALWAGHFRRGMDPLAVPRVEICRRDVGWRFAFKTRFPRLASWITR